jgi:hypothetical protein
MAKWRMDEAALRENMLEVKLRNREVGNYRSLPAKMQRIKAASQLRCH